MSILGLRGEGDLVGREVSFLDNDGIERIGKVTNQGEGALVVETDEDFWDALETDVDPIPLGEFKDKVGQSPWGSAWHFVWPSGQSLCRAIRSVRDWKYGKPTCMRCQAAVGRVIGEILQMLVALGNSRTAV